MPIYFQLIQVQVHAGARGHSRSASEPEALSGTLLRVCQLRPGSSSGASSAVGAGASMVQFDDTKLGATTGQCKKNSPSCQPTSSTNSKPDNWSEFIFFIPEPWRTNSSIKKSFPSCVRMKKVCGVILFFVSAASLALFNLWMLLVRSRHVKGVYIATLL